jgi:Helix-turn-helix domain
MSQPKTQNEKIIDWLKRPGRTLTRLQCFRKFGFFTLNSRASEINKQGRYRIKSKMIKLKSGSRVAQYYMV